MPNFLNPILSSVIYSFVGLFILLIAYWIIERITPEKTWHEIAANKNIALAIIMASLIIGMSLIISAAIHG